MYSIGVDLGKRNDFTAIVIVERRDIIRAYLPPSFEGIHVRYAERVPLGTLYMSVAERLKKIVQHPNMAGKCMVTVDATGLGDPVMEMLRAAKLGCQLSSVKITAGDREHTYSEAGGTYHCVPKQNLIGGVQALLERQQLKIAAKLRERHNLLKEMLDMEVSEGNRGKSKYAAEGEGEHDDLVMALSLAIWRANRPTVGWVSHRLPGI
jgi:hypothetical protein